MIKFLIVDDEPLVRNGLLNSIEWKEYQIDVIGAASNGLEAIDIIEKNPPDIVLTDIRMPGMDGLELAEWIKVNYPQILVVFLTGYSEFEYARAALKLDAVDYLLKPVNEEELRGILDRLRVSIESKHRQEQEDIRKREIIKEAMLVLQDNFISSILNEQMNAALIEERMSFYEIPFSAESFMITVFEVNLPDTSTEGGLTLSNVKKSLKEMIISVFSSFDQKYVLSSENYLILILSLNQKNTCEKSNNEVPQFFEEIRKSANTKAFKVNIGVSGIYAGMENVNVCYAEALNSLILGGRQSRKTVEEIKRFIESNYMKDIDLKTISDKFYLNSSYLSRLFSCETGISFTDYLTQCRMDKAVVLMKDPALKIYEISEMVGYSSEKYFARVFKKSFGITPYEYREKKS